MQIVWIRGPPRWAIAKLWILVRDGSDVRRFEQTGDVLRLRPRHRELADAWNTPQPGTVRFRPDGEEPITIACVDLVGVGLHEEDPDPPPRAERP